MSIISNAEKMYRSNVPFTFPGEQRDSCWPWAPRQPVFIDFLRRSDICICSVLPTIGAYCTTSKHYGPGRPFSCTHWSFPASLALLVAAQEPRARRRLIKTPGRALCRGKWEHIKSKWSAGTRLSFLLAPLLVQWPCFTTQSLSVLPHRLKSLLRSSSCPFLLMPIFPITPVVLLIWPWRFMCLVHLDAFQHTVRMHVTLKVPCPSRFQVCAFHPRLQWSSLESFIPQKPL